jgi:hypothetical protein
LKVWGRRYGLLELKIMNERCGENCVCADYDAEFPTACNRTTSLIRKESDPSIKMEDFTMPPINLDTIGKAK